MNTYQYNLVEKLSFLRYGCKAYKLALSAVKTCPNRDGRVGYGGCIFCCDRRLERIPDGEIEKKRG